jgi:hypothetical protein
LRTVPPPGWSYSRWLVIAARWLADHAGQQGEQRLLGVGAGGGGLGGVDDQQGRLDHGAEHQLGEHRDRRVRQQPFARGGRAHEQVTRLPRDPVAQPL